MNVAPADFAASFDKWDRAYLLMTYLLIMASSFLHGADLFQGFFISAVATVFVATACFLLPPLAIIVPVVAVIDIIKTLTA